MVGVTKLYCGTVEGSDSLRYGKEGEPHRARRPVVVWNCTRQCNLRCVHCYARAGDRPSGGEMTTQEGYDLLDDLARYGVPVVLFSGGEPLMRPDIYDLLQHTVRAGMRAVISTNGTVINSERAERLKQCGVSYVGISLDGLRRIHDLFRGVDGTFDRTLEGIRRSVVAGLKVGLRFTITHSNYHDIPNLFKLIRDEGISRVCFYHLVYAGRGAAMMYDDLSHATMRRTMDLIIDEAAALHAEQRGVEVLTVDNHADGPYVYLRMEREGNPRAEQVLHLLTRNGGNASGQAIACVSWDGAVHPDQFWRHASVGNVREQPFSELWETPSNTLLPQLRQRKALLRGRCVDCRFLGACNGNLRVRAEAATGDLWGQDPACYLTDEEIRTSCAAEASHREKTLA